MGKKSHVYWPPKQGASMRVALYIRTSTDKQLTGLEAQERALKQHCKSKEILNFSLYKEFGVSGSKSSRPELDEMMKDIRDGEIQTVIVYSFSRFARSTKHLLDALDEFHQLGVNFISITENIDTSTPMGKAMFTLTG
jgi:DNA invertase Pin-like site-specific DNA recombinase